MLDDVIGDMLDNYQPVENTSGMDFTTVISYLKRLETSGREKDVIELDLIQAVATIAQRFKPEYSTNSLSVILTYLSKFEVFTWYNPKKSATNFKEFSTSETAKQIAMSLLRDAFLIYAGRSGKAPIDLVADIKQKYKMHVPDCSEEETYSWVMLFLLSVYTSKNMPLCVAVVASNSNNVI